MKQEYAKKLKQAETRIRKTFEDCILKRKDGVEW